MDGLIKFVWVVIIGLLEGFCEDVCFLVDWYLEGCYGFLFLILYYNVVLYIKLVCIDKGIYIYYCYSKFYLLNKCI